MYDPLAVAVRCADCMHSMSYTLHYNEDKNTLSIEAYPCRICHEDGQEDKPFKKREV